MKWWKYYVTCSMWELCCNVQIILSTLKSVRIYLNIKNLFKNYFKVIYCVAQFKYFNQFLKTKQFVQANILNATKKYVGKYKLYTDKSTLSAIWSFTVVYYSAKATSSKFLSTECNMEMKSTKWSAPVDNPGWKWQVWFF